MFVQTNVPQLATHTQSSLLFSAKQTRIALKVSIAFTASAQQFNNRKYTIGQRYMIPPDPENSHINCHYDMGVWIHHLEAQLGRALLPDDYIFPAIASTRRLKFGEPISRSAFENLMDEIVDGSGVLIGRNVIFSTHCFRRGGAQYRFMWAKHKWSLKAVKWRGGGWSSSENVSNLFSGLNNLRLQF